MTAAYTQEGSLRREVRLHHGAHGASWSIMEHHGAHGLHDSIHTSDIHNRDPWTDLVTNLVTVPLRLEPGFRSPSR